MASPRKNGKMKNDSELQNAEKGREKVEKGLSIFCIERSNHFLMDTDQYRSVNPVVKLFTSLNDVCLLGSFT